PEEVAVLAGRRFGPVVLDLAEIVPPLRGHDRNAVLFDVFDLWIHVEQEPMIEGAPPGIRIIHNERQTAGFLRNVLDMKRRNSILAVHGELVRDRLSLGERMTCDLHKTSFPKKRSSLNGVRQTQFSHCLLTLAAARFAGARERSAAVSKTIRSASDCN